MPPQKQSKRTGTAVPLASKRPKGRPSTGGKSVARKSIVGAPKAKRRSSGPNPKSAKLADTNPAPLPCAKSVATNAPPTSSSSDFLSRASSAKSPYPLSLPAARPFDGNPKLSKRCKNPQKLS
ncbi:MAG: hypothetical protein LQ337_007672, partial [Flavoplaca oasis]